MSRRPRGSTAAGLGLLFMLTLVASFGCDSERASVGVEAPPREASRSEAPTAVPTDWCAEHQVPESKCTKCNPDLVAGFEARGDWCDAHGFPESVCPVCNPQSEPAAATDWCVEHGLPESQCTKCNPELVAEVRAAGDWCDEHGFPESVCPSCNPATPPPSAEQAALEARVVRLRASELEAAAGIRTAPARRVATTSVVECTAQIEFDADRIADIRAMVPGVVRRVIVQVGARVEPGDPLFELESTDVGAIQSALHAARGRVRTAEANLDRQLDLRGADIASAREVELAEQELVAAKADVRAAQAALTMAGAGSSQVGRYTITAPIAGTVLRRPALVGTVATAETSLATLGDTSIMWAQCEVPEASADRIAAGQTLRVSADTDPDTSVAGPITWIAAEVDPRTRTVTARAEVDNPEGTLRANQFMRGQITTGSSRAVVAVPRAAIQRIGRRELVFVRTEAGVYEPRVVRRLGGIEMVEIEGRVAVGDEVVTVGAVLLRTEMMPGSIGAGCCEVEAPGGE